MVNNSEELKESFKNEQVYAKFMSSLITVKSYFLEEYEFLALKDTTWDKLFFSVLWKVLKVLSPFLQLKS